jgi:hypothetical protein
MALPSSGPISALAIINEIGMPQADFSFGSREAISLATDQIYPAPNSTTVGARMFYDTSWRKSVTLTATTASQVTLNATTSATIPGRTDIYYTVPVSTWVYSGDTSVAALFATGGRANNDTYWKDSISIRIDGGGILGKGGKGGDSLPNTAAARAGKPGGAAIDIMTTTGVPVTVLLTSANGRPGYLCGGGGGGGAIGGGSSLAGSDTGNGGGGAGYGIGGGALARTNIPGPPTQRGQQIGDTPNAQKFMGGMGGTIVPGVTVPDPVGYLYSYAAAGGSGGQLVTLGIGYNGGLGGDTSNAGTGTYYSSPSGPRQGGAGGGGWGASGGSAQMTNFGNFTAPGGAGGPAIKKNGRDVTVRNTSGVINGSQLA